MAEAVQFDVGADSTTLALLPLLGRLFGNVCFVRGFLSLQCGGYDALLNQPGSGDVPLEAFSILVVHGDEPSYPAVLGGGMFSATPRWSNAFKPATPLTVSSPCIAAVIDRAAMERVFWKHPSARTAADALCSALHTPCGVALAASWVLVGLSPSALAELEQRLVPRVLERGMALSGAMYVLVWGRVALTAADGRHMSKHMSKQR